MKKFFKQKKGITLIALVITIIVLLILAGISISMLSGDNGILTRTTDAKTNTENTQTKEKIQLAYHSALAGGQGSYTKESLETELEKEFGENNYNVDDSDNTNWILSAQGQDVTIPAGKKTTNSNTKLSENELRTIIENESDDCMIDENGNIMSKNLWRYRLNSGNNTASIEGDSDDDGNVIIAYNGNVIDGKLENKIPVFIKIENTTYKVTELGDWALLSLRLNSVNIPDTITVLGYSCLAGNNLTSLVIPDSVTIVRNYFISGNPLTKLKLSDNLEIIGECAFYNFTSLNEITIPSTVTNVGMLAFKGWTSSQTINVPFKEGNRPGGWDNAWNAYCNAVINYAE